MVQAIARLLGWAAPPLPARLARVEDIAAAPPPGLVVARRGEPGTPPALDLETLRARNRERALQIARRNRSDG